MDIPEAFPVENEKFGGQIRRKLDGNYLIVYTIRTTSVEIVHVVQSAGHLDVLFD